MKRSDGITLIPTSTSAIGLVVIFVGLLEHLGTVGYLLYIIPFTHTVALINKFLFFPASPLEVLFHGLQLIESIVVVFVVAFRVRMLRAADEMMLAWHLR